MPPKLVDILTPAEIAALQLGYARDPAYLANFAESAYAAMFPGGAPAFNGFVDSVFTHGAPPTPPSTGIRGAERERSIIAILASRAATTELAIHLYWGVGEGLVVEDLCQIMLLVGGYSGFSNYTGGLGVVAKTLAALKGLFPACTCEPVAPKAALAAIQAAFAR
jgi:hypothetical protein